MSFMIAAAGTGGHVFPGLAVGEALIAEGVSRDDIMYVGGQRLESQVYPDHGFGFVGLELRGLRRSMSPVNLSLPLVVIRARNRIRREIRSQHVGCVLGMGGYATLPAALAARGTRTPLMICEQNAGAGLANRVASRWAAKVFTSFPETEGLAGAEWVGNPVRAYIAGFDRSELRSKALERYGFRDDIPTIGVFGGSLGAAVINNAAADMVREWDSGPLQVVHLVGSIHTGAITAEAAAGVAWVRLGFEDRMDLFFAASDLVIARAGGAVAEITATGSPSILVPGDFGSSGHQEANARYLADSGAAEIVRQSELGRIGEVAARLVSDRDRLFAMGEASRSIARPDAAIRVARAMIEAAT